MNNGYHAQLNRLEAQVKQLTAERDELRADRDDWKLQWDLLEADYKELSTDNIVLRERNNALLAKREPLSEDALDKLRQADNGKLNYVGIGQFKTIARAIEQAHGITDERLKDL